jgi:hypothetical protein
VIKKGGAGAVGSYIPSTQELQVSSAQDVLPAACCSSSELVPCLANTTMCSCCCCSCWSQ